MDMSHHGWCKYLCGLLFWSISSQNPGSILVSGGLGCRDPGYIENGIRIPRGKETEKVKFICGEGYKLVGESSIMTCLDGGDWDPPYKPICSNGRLCGKPPRILHADHKQYGTVVAYFCLDNYKLADPQAHKLQCNQGMWVGKRPACILSCDAPPEISRGTFIIIGESFRYEVGTQIWYKCEEGFSLLGQRQMKCSDAGWSHDAPRCIKRGGCRDPGSLQFGRFDCAEGRCELADGVYDTGTQLKVFCDNGHKLNGDFVLRCLENGEWSNSIPVCAKASTPLPDYLSDHDGQSVTNTMTIVIITSCTVLGVLLITMIAVAVQRRKSQLRLCTTVPTPPSLYNPTYPVPAPIAEHDRLALIAYADQPQALLPSYEEATRGRVRTHTPLQRLMPSNRGHEFRQLPSIPPGIRRQASSETSSSGGAHRDADTISRHSTITTSTVNREAFGSIDTVNVSDGTSTSVTVETYDSGASMPSIAQSRRGRAGSLESTASLINEDSLHSPDGQSQEITSNEQHSSELEEKEDY